MGVLTLTQLETDMESALGNPGLVSAVKTRLVNRGYLDLTSAVDFEALDSTKSITTADGTDSYTGPTDPLAVKTVYDDTNNYKLEWRPKDSFWRIHASGAAKGEPKKWTLDGANVLLHPTPDGIYTVKAIYKKQPTLLSAGGDTTAIPELWDAAVFLLAVSHGFLYISRENRALVYRNYAINYVQSRMSEKKFEEGEVGLGPQFPLPQPAEER